MTLLLADLTGWVGAAVLLAAYGMFSFKKLPPDSSWYQSLNAAGSGPVMLTWLQQLITQTDLSLRNLLKGLAVCLFYETSASSLSLLSEYPRTDAPPTSHRKEQKNEIPVYSTFPRSVFGRIDDGFCHSCSGGRCDGPQPDLWNSYSAKDQHRRA